MISIFKRKPKEETVSRAEYDRLEVAFNKMMTERNELRPDALKYRASIARLHAANARLSHSTPGDAEVREEAVCDIAAELRTFAMNMRRDDTDARCDDLRFYYEAIEGFADRLLATPSAQSGDAEVRESLEDFCLSAECAAGCDEGVTPDQAYTEILSFAGSALASSYSRARNALATPSGRAQGEDDVEAVQRSMDNAIAQVAADAIRASFFTSVSGGGRYYLSLAYRSMDAMHKAEDEIKAFLRWPRFLPLEERLASYAAPPAQDQTKGAES